MPVLKVQALIDERVEAIRAYHKDARVSQAELDLSGGIDSAVMACLLVEALGADKVTLVHSRINTSPDQTGRAKALAQGLGAKLIDIDLTRLFSTLQAKMEDALFAAGYDMAQVKQRCSTDKTIWGGLRSCLRAPIGRGFNRLTGNGIRHGTGNECEDRFLRYFQKGGDGEVDTNPIDMLSKVEVYQLAWGLAQRLPKAKQAILDTINAIPSADLWGKAKKGPGQTDETEVKNWLGVAFTYGRLDTATGEILSYGTIERVNRLCDLPFTANNLQSFPTIGGLLFERAPDSKIVNRQDYADAIISIAMATSFKGFTWAETQGFLAAAKRAEKATRHKEANLPSLGSRETLVDLGILSNEIPPKEA